VSVSVTDAELPVPLSVTLGTEKAGVTQTVVLVGLHGRFSTPDDEVEKFTVPLNPFSEVAVTV
jgi:hypothetical protein